MRTLPLLSSLAVSLATLALGGAALATPGASAAHAERLAVKTKGLTALATPLSQTAPAAAVEAAARAVVAAELPVASGLSLVSPKVVTLASGDRVVKLRQEHAGLPVVHRGVTVAFRAGAPRLAAARVERSFPASATPLVSEAEALAAAEARTGMASDGSAVLAWWPTGDGVKLAWGVAADAMLGVPHRPLTVVDAQTGAVLSVHETVLELNLADIYPSNPVKSPTLETVTLPVGAGETTLQNTLVRSLNCIDLKSVKSVNIMGFPLDVHTCDLLQTALPDANGDYLVPPAANTEPEDAYSEISMFHHANRAYELFRGWDPNLDLNGGVPFNTISNLRIPQGFDTFDLAKIADPDLPLVPFQNAFYAPADPLFSTVFGIQGGAMWFGQGPLRDYAYDGDVVYHELTHAVVGATIQLVGTPHMDEWGASYSPGGMNEGLADYFASALTGDPDMGEYAVQDFSPGAGFIRSLAAADACPTAIGGEVHQDATLFSGGLWDVRSTLAGPEQALFDGAVFAALNVAPTGDLSYDELALLIAGEVETALGAATSGALEAAWTTRGILPKCTRVLEHLGDELSGPPELQGLWFAPGTQTTGVTNGPGDWTPGVVQFHHTLPAEASTLTVSFQKVNVSSGVGFGGNATPFAPKLLVRFSADPINFEYQPLRTTTEDVLEVVPTEAGTDQFSATLDVPAGAGHAHVMITSTGQADGAYTDVAMSVMTGGGQGGGGAGGGGVGGEAPGGGGAGGQVTGNPVAPEAGGGCGCEVPGAGSTSSSAVAAMLAALGLALGRVRRRRSRA
jgi:MYXO-CTERM domain-containing protein